MKVINLSNVRVTYSGLIAFIVSILSVLTGTIFVVMVTRKLSPEDLGLWTLIGSLISYVLIIRPIISYWSTRQIARGERVEKTALATSGLFSTIGTTVYFGIAIAVSAYLGVELFVLLIASALIPLQFINDILASIALSKKPQTISYSLLVFESSKIPIGIFLVVYLQLGIVGVLLTIILATAIKQVLLWIWMAQYIRGEIKLQFVKYWLRMSWLTLYQGGSRLVRSLDVLIYPLLTGSLIGLAYWAVSQTVAQISSYSERVNQGLYPKLLADGKKEFAEINFKRIMFFAIPLLATSIIFAKPALHVLNPLYVDGVYIAIILSMRSFIFLISGISFNILRAFETVDINQNASFKQYIKSKLFVLPTINYISHGSYVAVLGLFLYFMNDFSSKEADIVTIWSLIYFLITLPMMIYGLISIKRNYKIQMPIYAMAKFTGITIIASVTIFFISETSLVYTESVYEFLPQLIPLLALGGVMYFGIMYVIDKDTRKLFKSILREIRHH